MKFDEDEANYDQWRPTYVPGLFEDIIAYARLDSSRQALEIGLGTGQATLPILQMDTLQRYGFMNRRSKLFYQTRAFTAPDYIALLNTYSDHRAMPEHAKRGLEQGIASAIDAFGGILQVYDTMDLYLAQKP